MGEMNRPGNSLPLKSGSSFGLFYSPVTPWLVLTTTLALTLFSFNLSRKLYTQQAWDRFDDRVREVSAAIEFRMLASETLLRSGVGLYNAVDMMTRAKWKRYVDTLRIREYWPGIQGIGFSVPVAPADREAHIQQIRGEGFADYTIRPEGEREKYTSIIYLEPFDWRNQRAFGYDMGTNPVRREAMERARDTGEAATTGRITLVQETDQDVQQGFLTYLPVYRKDSPELQTVEQRREAFQGWVYAAFRAGDLMRGVLHAKDTKLGFEIYDGELPDRDFLLYATSNSHGADGPDLSGGFKKTVQLVQEGRIWTIRFYSSDTLSAEERNQPRILLAAGAMISLLLFYVVLAMRSIQGRAVSIAQKMTAELNASKEGLEEKVRERTRALEELTRTLEVKVRERTEEMQRRVEDLESLNKLMVGREKKMMELKRQLQKFEKPEGGNRDGA